MRIEAEVLRMRAPARDLQRCDAALYGFHDGSRRIIEEAERESQRLLTEMQAASEALYSHQLDHGRWN